MPQRKVLTQGNDFMGYSKWPIKINNKHMKSSMTKKSHTGMNISSARFHMTIEKQL
ncbi:hypothetical protein SAMN04489724_3657 [Algoriphagus locisalis]|uniref:Uncharacterized protein n=1 Tax=Algoriphagus locisalis TaxID=305507 RepID=A0A1I7D190_9BACT|nr:hypothetical protein SAMN04489724_3657 [Algoriphagus locisalis]